MSNKRLMSDNFTCSTDDAVGADATRVDAANDDDATSANEACAKEPSSQKLPDVAPLFETASEIENSVCEWRHYLHQHPELSNREDKTAEYIVQRLHEFGFADADIHTHIGKTGVVAELRGGLSGSGAADSSRGDSSHADSPRAVLLRADIDGLPVKEETGLPYASEEVQEYPDGSHPVTHACGHDMHIAMLLGAAKVLSEHKDQLNGSVYFVFQPAEEGAPVEEEGGAAYMMKDPIFEQLNPAPSLSFGMHVIPAPSGMVGVRKNVQHASSEMVKITVHGEQVHGSSPWAGKDPLPAAAQIISAMGQIYRQVDAACPFTISIGHVEDQGRFNIVGGKVTLWGTVRCLDPDLMDVVNEKIERTARNIGAAYDCETQTEFLQQIPAVVNDPGTVDCLLPAFAAAAGGEEKVFAAPASLGYDDVSEFINAYGGVYALLGVQDLHFTSDGSLEPCDGGRGFQPNHSPKFYGNDEALIVGVRMHVAVAAQHLSA